MKRCVLILLLLILSACGPEHWKNYDAIKSNQQYFDKDYADCKLAGIRQYGSDSATEPSFIHNCLKAKGWYGVKK